MQSADYPMTRCLSVCLAILVFPYQTRWQYSDRDPPNKGVKCMGVWKQEAQLSQRLRDAIEYFAKSLKIIRNDTIE